MVYSVKNARVLVTGGAGGMGLLYARRAVSEGAAHVSIWDANPEAIGSARASLSEQGAALSNSFGASPASIAARLVDVSDRDAVRAAAAEELDEGTPDLLINNAGIVRGNSYFWQTDTERDTVPTIAVNTLAPMTLTRELLPAMVADASRERRILNIASAAALVSNPRMSVYAASKWAMLAWSDSVRLELRQAGHRHIAVTTFCPSYVSTGMFEGVKGPTLTPVLTPASAVEKAWTAMLRGKAQKLAPWTVGFSRVMRGVLPTAAWDVVADRVFHVYGSMAGFVGHGAGASTTSKAGVH